jgi:PAS domain-containing protein
MSAVQEASARNVADEHLTPVDTGRIFMQEALRESEERYRMLLDGIQDYAIFMMDPLGNIISWNAGAERIKGYTADEIIGRSFSCFFPSEDIQRGRPEEILRLTAETGAARGAKHAQAQERLPILGGRNLYCSKRHQWKPKGVF